MGYSALEQKKDIKRKMIEIWIISVGELKIWDINIKGKWEKDKCELSMLFFFFLQSFCQSKISLKEISRAEKQRKRNGEIQKPQHSTSL